STSASNCILTGGKYTAGTLLGSVTISSSNATLGTSGGQPGQMGEPPSGQPGGQQGQMGEPPSGEPPSGQPGQM
ncbi:MAG: protocatechuate dioxygenase, partial [Candidatus Riflebacteria bacterium]|nr:protocatechuate dioxygenase [Candidatus Riflebacteria bacterium]